MHEDMRQYTLWTCLICGHIGCFNLMTKMDTQSQDIDDQVTLENVQKGHAFTHYKESMHVYAMEITTKKVWDFSRENYVYRLLQNGTDGKLVELQEPPSEHSSEQNQIPQSS